MPMKNPPHPGKGLKADFNALELSVAQAADALGISRAQLHRIVAGDSSITPEVALKLEVVIGSTAEAWLRLQAAYDAAQVRLRANEVTKGLSRIRLPTEPQPEQPNTV